MGGNIFRGFYFCFGISFLLSGCALLDFGRAPEYSLVGCRVAVMPFSGPGKSWYGESAISRKLFSQVVATLRAGGVEVCQSSRIEKELSEFAEEGEPPWIQYGRELQAQYVIVAHLIDWEVGSPDAVAFVPGKCLMDVRLYDVDQGKLVLQRRISAAVGTADTSGEFYVDSRKTTFMLTKKVLALWKALFVERSEFD